MKVVFKTGAEIEIHEAVAERLKENLLRPSGTANWQVFSDENNKVHLIINLPEVLYIR